MNLSDISIRNMLLPGDLGYIIHLHGRLYKKEYNYGVEFESYVAAGLSEFYQQYDETRDRMWICEHKHKIIASLLLMHRENNTAQLRYFIMEPEYRGIGLGKKLMQLFVDFLNDRGYTSAYLWTTDELLAAAALYTRFGFRLSEEKPSAAFGKPVKEQRYDWVAEK